MPVESYDQDLVCVRPQPCEACARGSTLIDFLIGRDEASGPVQGGTTDEIVERQTARERVWLVEWAELCPHTSWDSYKLPKLDEGSEHIVYLVTEKKAVLKVTKPGVYGDLYYLEDGRVYERRNTPAEYLLRLAMIKMHFGFAPVPIGVTPTGQIVSMQDFVQGEPPTQTEVDDFLSGAGLVPVKQNCWIWKFPLPIDDVEFWIGDARADNFVKTDSGIVPIDIRMWGVTPDSL
jgi:hypothetical protein